MEAGIDLGPHPLAAHARLGRVDRLRRAGFAGIERGLIDRISAQDLDGRLHLPLAFGCRHLPRSGVNPVRGHFAILRDLDIVTAAGVLGLKFGVGGLAWKLPLGNADGLHKRQLGIGRSGDLAGALRRIRRCNNRDGNSREKGDASRSDFQHSGSLRSGPIPSLIDADS